jgi:hypothetical protein
MQNKELLYFPFFINQYTGLLSRYSLEQRGAFISLLCVFLQDGGQLSENEDEVYRQCLAFTDSERKAIVYVKEKVLQVGKEILETQGKRTRARSNSGKIGAEARWEKKNKTHPLVIENLSLSLKEPTPPLVKTTPPIKKEPLKKKKNILLSDFLIGEYKKENASENLNQETNIPDSMATVWEERNGVDDKALLAKYTNFYQYWTGKGKTIPPDPYKIDWIKTWINYIERK